MNFPSTPPSSFALNTQCSKETIKKCARKTCRIQFTSDILAFSFLISILILVIRYSMEYHHKWLLACNSYYLGRPQRLQIMSIVFLYDANFSSKILKRTLHCNAQWSKSNIYCTNLWEVLETSDSNLKVTLFVCFFNWLDSSSSPVVIYSFIYFPIFSL